MRLVLAASFAALAVLGAWFLASRLLAPLRPPGAGEPAAGRTLAVRVIEDGGGPAAGLEVVAGVRRASGEFAPLGAARTGGDGVAVLRLPAASARRLAARPRPLVFELRFPHRETLRHEGAPRASVTAPPLELSLPAAGWVDFVLLDEEGAPAAGEFRLHVRWRPDDSTEGAPARSAEIWLPLCDGRVAFACGPGLRLELALSRPGGGRKELGEAHGPALAGERVVVERPLPAWKAGAPPR